MLYREAHGTCIPALGFGTYQLKDEEGRRSVAEALEIGYRHIDTAQDYGNEHDIGAVVAASGISRSELFITTKVWWERLDHHGVKQSFQRSLDSLQTDYIDLLLIHWDNDAIPLTETLAVMNHLQDQGRVHQIGVSNFTVPRLKADLERSRTPIFTNQIEYHPFLGQAEIRAYCLSKHILTTAYCPVARGEVLRDPVLQRLGHKHGKSPAQVTLRWLLQQEQVLAIPRSSDPRHIRSNFDVFDFTLSCEDMNLIYALERNQRKIDPDFAPDWEAEKPVSTDDMVSTHRT